MRNKILIVVVAGGILLVGADWYYGRAVHNEDQATQKTDGLEPTNQEVQRAKSALEQCTERWIKEGMPTDPGMGCRAERESLESKRSLDPAYFAARDEKRENDRQGLRREAESVAIKLIEEWKAARSGLDYWATDADPIQLYAVRDYQSLGCSGSPYAVVTCRFRIDSSTKGGFPIIKVWAIDLATSAMAIAMGNDWEIRRVEETP